MSKTIRIGTRESQLAIWQSNQVRQLLSQHGYDAELVLIKSGGDIDLKTPLYEMGVQGIFTKELDTAILNNRVDIAVHSLKDVPTQTADGLQVTAVLERGPVEDLLVFKGDDDHRMYDVLTDSAPFTIATSSIRRKAQWLNRFPHHRIENLRGNVNTRLRKLTEQGWNAAIFARAGLERIDLRPADSIILDWMLPAPAQGAIGIVGRADDDYCVEACANLNNKETALCTGIERDFLRALLGGCSTPISAIAQVRNDEVYFAGNILSVDGRHKATLEERLPITEAAGWGKRLAEKILNKGGRAIAESIRNAGK
jgi:hydroxymethylbilane synthase